MATDLIENSDLSALAHHPDNRPFADNYYSFLGIGKNKKDIKKVAASVVNSPAADNSFRNQMATIYKGINKGKNQETNVALTNMAKLNGLQAVYQAVQDFGSPKNIKDLQMHNEAVRVYLQYFIPDQPAKTQDCANLNSLLAQLEADVEAENTKGSVAGEKGIKNQASLLALSERVKVVKQLIVSSDCENIANKAAQEQEQTSTLDTLKKAIAPTTAAGAKTDNTLKYISYGLAAAVVVIAIVVYRKKS